VCSLLSRIVVVSVFSVSELGRSVWWIWDFLAWISLTGKLHQPNWCRGLLFEVLRFW
jgi:hypothetical protein